MELSSDTPQVRALSWLCVLSFLTLAELRQKGSDDIKPVAPSYQYLHMWTLPSSEKIPVVDSHVWCHNSKSHCGYIGEEELF